MAFVSKRSCAYVCVNSPGGSVCILYSSLSCVSVPKFWKCTSKLEDFPLDLCRNYHIWGFASVLLTEGIWISLDTKNLVFIKYL